MKKLKYKISIAISSAIILTVSIDNPGQQQTYIFGNSQNPDLILKNFFFGTLQGSGAVSMQQHCIFYEIANLIFVVAYKNKCSEGEEESEREREGGRRTRTEKLLCIINKPNAYCSLDTRLVCMQMKIHVSKKFKKPSNRIKLLMGIFIIYIGTVQVHTRCVPGLCIHRTYILFVSKTYAV